MNTPQEIDKLLIAEFNEAKIAFLKYKELDNDDAMLAMQNVIDCCVFLNDATRIELKRLEFEANNYDSNIMAALSVKTSEDEDDFWENMYDQEYDENDMDKIAYFMKKYKITELTIDDYDSEEEDEIWRNENGKNN